MKKRTSNIARPQVWYRFFRRVFRDFFVERLFYSFPVQLLFYNFKRNLIVLLLWGILYAIVTENIGTSLGIPSLFLDPEYRHQVDFWSFFMIGVSLGIFMMSFHIICYILNAPQFSFIGNLPTPFTKFFVNNSLIPAFFLIVYLRHIFSFQLSHESHTLQLTLERVAGLLSGIIVSGTLLFLYFIGTNQDIFKLLAQKVDKRLKRTKIVRVNVLGRLQETRSHPIKINYYLNNYCRPCKVDERLHNDAETILKVFDQNHLNGVIIQLTILGMVLVAGTLRDYEVFQIPAGASFVMLFTILLMFAGAINYWLRSWAFTFTIFLFLVLNYVMKEEVLIAKYEAYGLNYRTTKSEYSLQRVKEMSNDSLYKHDRAYTLFALENWKEKHRKLNPKEKPKMVFVCTSGGGQRAAVWTMRTLQYVDSTLRGKLMRHTMLMTGASGGLVGAAYFRELWLRRELFYRTGKGEAPDPYDIRYLDNIAKDNLNAIVFSLVVNDIFFGFQTFQYAGQRYFKDRGFAFEQQLNRNTRGILDKPLCDYREPELFSFVPMLILAPTVVNDGRKLFISPLNVSYMTVPTPDRPRFLNQKTKGIEFLRFFEEQNAANLRFLSALRMSATFPYVTPNVKLPSEPEMEIMDAGLSDNFGVSDAVRFIYSFRQWIEEHTSGVIVISIRDTQKDNPIEKSLEQSLFQRVFTPISSLYGNLEYLQDINNDNMLEFAQSWFPRNFPIHRVVFQYVPLSHSLQEIEAEKKRIESGEKQEGIRIVKIERAALSWRLTDKEKASLKRTIYELRNQYAVRQLERLLE